MLEGHRIAHSTTKFPQLIFIFRKVKLKFQFYGGAA